MSINSFEVNPLDVLKCRELEYLPNHFQTVVIEYSSLDLIKKWILNKLQGRYCLTKTILLNEDKIENKLVAGFEKHKELTYFMLACPHIRR